MEEAEKIDSDAKQQLRTRRIKPVFIGKLSEPLQVDNQIFKNGDSQQSKPMFKNFQRLQVEFPNPYSILYQNKNKSPPSSSSANVVSNMKIHPKFGKVTLQEDIVKIAELYCFLVSKSYKINILNEVKFLFQIVIKKCVIEESNTSSTSLLAKIFSSYHNCFYLVYISLYKLLFLHNLISFLNLSLLKCLVDCSSFFNFYPGQKESLMKITKLCSTEKEQERAIEINYSIINCSFVFNQTKTNECAQNFSNSFSSSIFRKQRDVFHLILDRYDNELSSGIATNDKKARRDFSLAILSMFDLSRDCVNISSLADLFYSKMIEKCIELSDLPSDEKKVKKLMDRINQINPNNVVSVHNYHLKLIQDIFKKEETFFCDFIYCADSHTFNQHLKLILQSELKKLITCDISGSLGKYTSVDAGNIFFVCLRKLCVLAKFLGFLTFYPYERQLFLNNKNSENFLTQQRVFQSMNEDNKQQVADFLDLEKYVLDSLNNRALIIAIPWVVEFMILIDPVTSLTPSYIGVVSLLICIYENYLSSSEDAAHSNRMFIQLYIEKLLSSCKISVSSLSKTDEFQELRNRIVPAYFSNVSEQPEKSSGLDFNVDIINNKTREYLLSHFSKEVIEIFKQNPNDTKARKMTLVSFRKTLLDKAEEQFLNINGESLKKSVMFLTDRLVTVLTKEIHNNFYPEIRKTKFNEFLSTNIQFKDNFQNWQNNEAFSKLTASFQADCTSYVEKNVRDRLSKIFPLIVDGDLGQDVIEFSCEICIKYVKQRCVSWIGANFKGANVFNHLQEHIRLQEQSKGMSKSLQLIAVHKVYSMFEKFIKDSRSKLDDLHQGVSTLEHDQLVTWLDDLKTIRQSEVLPLSSIQFIDTVLNDFFLCLVIFKPKLVDDVILDEWTELCTSCNIQFKRIVCSRNMHLLQKSPSPIETWRKYESLILRMLKFKMITFYDLEQETLALIKSEWPEDLLDRFASMLNEVLNHAKRNDLVSYNVDGSCSHDTIEFLSWICSREASFEF